MKTTSKVVIGIMGTILVALCVYFVFANNLGSKDISVESAYKYKTPVGYSSEIEPYVKYLEKNKDLNPVDYVIDLFEKYDIVVLCERNHKEITQYELIYKIVSDKRFIQKSGYVFTEIGSQTINDRLNKFLQTKDLNENEVKNQLKDLYRNLDINGYWEKYNPYDFFKKIHYLNNSLPKGQQIEVNCSDMPVDWDTITPAIYKQQITDKKASRDKIMADFITSKFKEIKKSKNKKILVIMNTRHGFKEHMGSNFNATAFLNEEFPGKVANIMINSVKELPGTNDKVTKLVPFQNGKWDASFRYLKNVNRAFDFNNSPFGEDRFDYYDSEEHKEYKYQDIFNGFIFYKPLEEHILEWNIPGVIDSEFFATFVKRLKMADPNIPDLTDVSKNQIDQEIKDKNTIKREFYPDIITFNPVIEQWLRY